LGRKSQSPPEYTQASGVMVVPASTAELSEPEVVSGNFPFTVFSSDLKNAHLSQKNLFADSEILLNLCIT
jgi:hypothetical protein